MEDERPDRDLNEDENQNEDEFTFGQAQKFIHGICGEFS
jgi:hypothetical protein